MKKLTKILVILLSVAILCTALIVAVGAESSGNTAKVGETEYANLAEALDAAEAGSTVTLVSDASIASYEVTKDITIDLNGYKLVSDPTDENKPYAFGLNANGIEFAIIGEGEISVSGRLIDSTEDVSVKIQSDYKPIEILHSGESSDEIIVAKSGTYVLNGVNVTAVSGGEYCFSMEDGGNAKYVFTAVKVVSNSHTDQKSGVIYIANKGSAEVYYCNFRTNGCAFVFEDQEEFRGQFLTVEKSNIVCAVSGSNNFAVGVFGAYSKIFGDIYVKDSYLSSPYRPIMISETQSYSDFAGSYHGVILDNSELHHDGWYSITGSIAGGTNLTLKNGSKVTSGGSLANFISAYTAGYKVYLEEGARFDSAAYNALMKDNMKTCLVYPDGTNGNTNTAYKFIYNPIADPSCEYKLVSVDSNEESISSSDVFYSIKTPSYTFGGSGAIGGKYTFPDGSAASKFTANTSASGGNPIVILFSDKTKSVMVGSTDLLVLDFDVGTDGTFIAGNVALQVRDAAGDVWAKSTYGSRSINVVYIAENGKVSLSGVTDSPSIQMDNNSMNHITLVVDTNAQDKGLVYCYVNGEYLGTNSAYNLPAEGGSNYVYGINYGYARKADRSILISNVTFRTYGDGSGSAITETDSEKYVYSSYNLASVVSGNSTAFTVAGMNLTNDINEALELGNTNGFVPKLEKALSNQTVTVNGKLYTAGNRITLSESSYRADFVIRNQTTFYGADFNEAYGNITAEYQLFTGDYRNESELLDASKWTTVGTIKIGDDLSNIKSLGEILVKEGTFFRTANHTGYYTEMGTFFGCDNPFNLEMYESQDENGVVKLYPAYSAPYQKFSWVVTDADGNFLRGWTQTQFWGSDWNERGKDGTGTGGDGTAAVKLHYGEIFVLQKSISMQAEFSTKFRDASSSEKTLNFDLNGQTITIAVKCDAFQTKATGETINMFSSLPGAKIVSTKAGVVLFKHNNGLGETLDAQEDAASNTHMNVGTLTLNGKQYDGKNIFLSGDVLVDARAADSTCVFTAKDVTFNHNSTDYGAPIFTRFYYGTINIEGCNIVMTANSSNNCLIRTHDNGNGAKAVVNVKDSTIIMYTNGQDVIGNISGVSKLTIENCVTNGNVRKQGGVILAGENVFASNIAAELEEGVIIAKCNKEIDLSAFITDGAEVYNGTYVGGTYVIAPYGYEGSANLVLPLLTKVTVKESDAVSATFKGLGTNADITEYYTKGSKVTAPTIADYTGTLITLTHTGEFDKPLSEVIEANEVYVPLYDVSSDISGIKVSSDLGTDFNINLYIPKEYSELVTVLGHETTEVTVDNISYIKASVAVLPNAATETVVFDITVTEAGVTLDETLTLSIADYAEKIFTDETKSEAEKVLAYYAINYANEAGKYFHGSKDNGENEKLTALLADYAEYKHSDLVTSYDSAVTSDDMSVAFDSATFYFNGKSPILIFDINDAFYMYDSSCETNYMSINGGEHVDMGSGILVVDYLTLTELLNVSIKIEMYDDILDENGEPIGEDTYVSEMFYGLGAFAKYHKDNAVVADGTEPTESQVASQNALAFIDALYAYADIANQYKTGALATKLTPAE